MLDLERFLNFVVLFLLAFGIFPSFFIEILISWKTEGGVCLLLPPTGLHMSEEIE